MKNKSLFPALLLLACFLIGFNSCKDKCGQDVSINAIMPDSNPKGHEVLLKTTGFSDSVKVVFGKVEASWRPGGLAGEIIATVPDGLSGNVEVSVEEGDCIARSGGFLVSGVLPSDVQASLSNIIIPTTSSLALPIDGFTNFWANAANVSSGINIIDTTISGVIQLSQSSKEFDFGNSFFNANPVSGSVNLSTNVIYFAVDRTAKGGFVEHFDGLFIDPPQSSLPVEGKYAILLVSRETGRQLLLYYPK
jgi:hypothetical protein